MSRNVIKIPERDGRAIMDALIGNSKELFEVWQHENGDIAYYIRLRRVSREVFFDALEIARLDQYDPQEGIALPEQGDGN